MVRTPSVALTIAAAAALSFALSGATPAVAAVPGGNLVVNGGAEYGPQASIIDFPVPAVPGWTRTNERFRTAPYEKPGGADGIIHSDDPGASGCRLFYGGTGSGYSPSGATQDVDVSGAATEIDGDGLTGRFAARLGGAGDADGDSAKVTFAMLDGSGAELGAVTFDDAATSRLSYAIKQYEMATSLPAGTRKVRITITQTAIGFDSYNDAYVDDVGLTLDGSDAKTAPAPGCQPPALATGAASEVTMTSARLNGIVDNRHEDVTWKFRYSPTTPVQFGLSTEGGTVPATSGPQGVSALATGLDPNTTYYGVLTADLPDGSEVRGNEVSFRTAAPAGATPPPQPTPTPAPQRRPTFDTFRTAVKIKAPSCIKKGSKITVTVADTTEKTRKLKRFIVQAGTGIGNAKQNRGKTGVTKSTLTVKKFPTKAPKNTRGAKLILTVIADFGDAPGFPDSVSSDQSISGSKQIRFCKAKPVKRKKRR